MAPKVGYLLPTREAIMGGRPEAAPLLRLSEQAEDLGYDSIWVGDSVTARPRHEPMTLLAGVAGRTRRPELGTAVMLPALRNPVLLAHQLATLDQISEGRVILGIGVANDWPSVQAEFEACGVPFEKRLGRMNEGLRLCRALWSGEPVDWDGRWKLEGATVGPTPHRPGGPPIWVGGATPGPVRRAGRTYDGWFPSGPGGVDLWARLWGEVQTHAREAGRDPAAVTGAMYLTFYIDDNLERAEENIDRFIVGYYEDKPSVIRQVQAFHGGSAESAAELLQAYADAGVSHFTLRFAGDHERHLETFAKVRESLGW